MLKKTCISLVQTIHCLHLVLQCPKYYLRYILFILFIFYKPIWQIKPPFLPEIKNTKWEIFKKENLTVLLYQKHVPDFTQDLFSLKSASSYYFRARLQAQLWHSKSGLTPLKYMELLQLLRRAEAGPLPATAWAAITATSRHREGKKNWDVWQGLVRNHLQTTSVGFPEQALLTGNTFCSKLFTIISNYYSFD